MDRVKCSFQQCNNDADFVSDTDDYVCEYCMIQEMDEWHKTEDDYEPISTLPYLPQNQKTKQGR